MSSCDDGFKNIPVDSLSIIRKDKKRNVNTIKKLGVTQEELLNGIPDNDAAKLLSDYFNKHEGIIVSYSTYSIVSGFNRECDRLGLKLISSFLFDMKKMTKKCDEDYPDDGTVENVKEALKFCLKKYERMEKISQNKMECVVNYAYFWQLEVGFGSEWIYCNTSIGLIYYDTLLDEWGVTKKESKKTGLKPENIDVDDIKRQLYEKYRVSSLDELKDKLKRKYEYRRAIEKENRTLCG